ncbi:MAG: hypothetical protein Q8P39_01875 [Candidatus Yanofskybacteria bacterium]|nr:hypothetical protein [Candidatus Yanofskybacteria bacterium]
MKEEDCRKIKQLGDKFIHKELAKGRWFELSLAEQLGNIGSEVSRAAKWQRKDKQLFEGAVERALELFDLTIMDSRWRVSRRLKEIGQAREVFCDAVFGGEEYGTTFQNLQPYFDQFAFAARKKINVT